MADQHYPNLSHPCNSSLFPCGVACRADTASTKFWASLVLFGITAITTLHVVVVFVTHHSTLHLGRRLCTWLVVDLLVMRLPLLFYFAEPSCHSDGTTRLDEPTGFNLCFVSSMLEFCSLIACVPLVLGIGYSFYRLIKLSNSARSMKSELVDRAYKAERIVGLVVVLLWVPAIVIVAHFQLVNGHPFIGRCYAYDPVFNGCVIGFMFVGFCSAITIAVVGLPKFVRLVNLSEKLRNAQASLKRSFKQRKRRFGKGKTAGAHKRNSYAETFLVEVSVFLATSALLLATMSSFYFVVHSRERFLKEDLRKYTLCNMASCRVVNDCVFSEGSITQIIFWIHVTLQLAGLALSWWTFKVAYLPLATLRWWKRSISLPSSLTTDRECPRRMAPTLSVCTDRALRAERTVKINSSPPKHTPRGQRSAGDDTYKSAASILLSSF